MLALSSTPENRPQPVMKQAIAIVACTLLVSSHAFAQQAAPAAHELPAAEELGRIPRRVGGTSDPTVLAWFS